MRLFFRGFDIGEFPLIDGSTLPPMTFPVVIQSRYQYIYGEVIYICGGSSYMYQDSVAGIYLVLQKLIVCHNLGKSILKIKRMAAYP